MQSINAKLGADSSVVGLEAKRKRQKSLDLNRQKSRLTLTIYLNCLKCLVGRFPIFVCFVLKNLTSLRSLQMDESLLDILFEVSIFCIYSAYAASFFIYYYANSLFRKTISEYWSKLKTKLKKSLVQ